ncbi:hypothetical protein Pan216_04940 [Planctomycetes bacterium Pan216]|uniref:DUF4384 domain-containing protein n=1 Tax=Kolteria novifilia TaxID=2527975 RepID=A0A518AY66_9BACT|nr:hypothetical protein Pan216_04940 [Planctomycetes bacterium Pan216]
MKRFAITTLVALGAICLSGLESHADESTPKFTTRGIIRAGVDKSGRVHGDLAKLTGLKNATSLNYKILLMNRDGTEKVVNEKDHTFTLAEQFRLIIEADSDLYVYVFHEGPDGIRTVLLPDAADEGRVPMVKKGSQKVIPDDGTYFEVVPPPGTEKLLVYATPEPRPELTPEEAFEDADGTKEEKKLKTTQDKVFESASSKQAKEAKTGNVEELAENLDEMPEFRLRGLRWTPEESSDEGKTVLVGSFDENKKPDLFVEIPLNSK